MVDSSKPGQEAECIPSGAEVDTCIQPAEAGTHIAAAVADRITPEPEEQHTAEEHSRARAYSRYTQAEVSGHNSRPFSIPLMTRMDKGE